MEQREMLTNDECAAMLLLADRIECAQEAPIPIGIAAADLIRRAIEAIELSQPRPMMADSAGEVEPCRKCKGLGYTSPGDPETGETWLDNLCVDCAAPAPSASPAALTAKQRYDQFMEPGEEPSAVERLRFFCSLAMSGQDWIDVEPFFNDILAAQPPAAAEAEKRDAAQYRLLRSRISGQRYPGMSFVLHIEPKDGANVMQGSLAEHFDNAIDAAMERAGTASKGEKA